MNLFCNSDESSGPIGYKSPRGGTRGLYPFPRTGRSGVRPQEYLRFSGNNFKNIFHKIVI